MAKLATDFNFDVTTDFGQIEQVINDKIGLNRAKARVAADLSSDGLADIKHEQAMEKAMGDQALKDFEVQMGLVTPETAGVTEAAKELGAGGKAEGNDVAEVGGRVKQFDRASRIPDNKRKTNLIIFADCFN